MTVEHDIIARYFAPLCSNSNDAPAFGLRDDTALIAASEKCGLLITTDALIAGVHFFPDDPPDAIAHKALGVNVSDIVAKGGTPRNYLLTLALPKDIDATWLTEFASGLGAAQQLYGCQLVGGDTVSTPGPLMVSVTMTGVCASGKMVRRSGARSGDIVFVSGTIGDAALGLMARRDELLKKGVELSPELQQMLVERYLRPQPRCELALMIGKFASAAMDISDGLVGDFSKLCAASCVGGLIEIPKVPLSKAAGMAVEQVPHLLETILAGGDDYEILATIPPGRADEFEQKAQNVARIGEITALDHGVIMLGADGRPIEIAQSAYDHFG